MSSSSPKTVEDIARKHDVPVYRIGRVTEAGNGFRVRGFGRMIESDIATLSTAWHGSIAAIMSAPALAAEPEDALTVV